MVGGGYGTRQIEEPINGVAASGVGFADGGFVVKAANSGADYDKTTGITDQPVGVVVDDTVDPTTGNTLTAKRIAIQRHGVVPVKSEAATWRRHDKAYLAATDGYVVNSDGGSAKCIGTYVGPDNVAYAAGDKVEIDLDASASQIL